MKDNHAARLDHASDQLPTSMNSPRDFIQKHAAETFGTEEKASHWLHRPNQLLGGKTPLEMLESDPDIVERELVRIDHGIFV